MTRRMYLLLLSFFGLSTGLHARRGARPIVATPTVDSSVEQLAEQYRDIDTLVEQAKRQAAEEKRKAERTIESLEGRMHRRQSRLEKRRQETLRREAEHRALLEKQAREQAEKVAQEAEKRALEIVRQAERRALVLRDKLQEQDAQDIANSRPKITTEWRTEVTNEFDADTAFMRRIVMEGEASRLERENFGALFDEQKQWFTTMRDKVAYFFDDHYQTVMHKKNDLASLVDAQRQADEIILDLVDKHHLSDTVKSQLRLQAMYEINNYLQTTKRRNIFLPVDTIHELVNKVTQEVAPGQRAITIVSEKQRIADLESRIGELEGQLSQVAAYAEQAPLATSGAVDAGNFSSVQEALQADRQATQEKIAALETEKNEQLAALEKEKDDTIASISAEANEKVAALSKEKHALEGKQVRRDEKHAARIQARIDALRAERKEAVLQAQKVAKMRIDELKKKHEKMVDALHEQRNKEVAKIKKQLDALRAERAKVHEQLVAEQAKLATERIKAQQLTQKLSHEKSQVTTLKKAVGGLKDEHEELRERHEKERASLVAHIKQRQREKTEMEVSLAQLQQQLAVLSSSSSKRLLSMASEISNRAATERDLQELLAKKSAQQVELEVAIAQATEQLHVLARQSHEVLTSAAGQLDHYEHRCGQLHDELRGKQEYVVHLEQSLSSLHATQQARAIRNEELKTQVIELQRATEALREQLRQSTAERSHLERLNALARQTRERLSGLIAELQRKYTVLQQRKYSFEQMEQVHHNLQRLRTARAADPVRDAEHVDLLARMASFGEELIRDHNEVTRATHHAQRADEQLAQLVPLLEDGSDENALEALGGLEVVLAALGDAAQVASSIEAEPVAPVVRPIEDQQSLQVAPHHTEDEEEEEPPHDPDEHPEMPDIVEEGGELHDLDGELPEPEDADPASMAEALIAAPVDVPEEENEESGDSDEEDGDGDDEEERTRMATLEEIEQELEKIVAESAEKEN